jgi:hypothetical protein
VDGLADLFFKLVSERRDISVDAVRGLQAGMFHGDKAVTAGLVDGIATWSEFLALIESGGIGGGAAKEKSRVDYKELVEALRAAAKGDDEEEAKKAKAGLVAMGEEEPEGDEEKKDEKAEGEEPKDGDKAKAEGEDGDKKDEEKKPSAKAAAKPSASTGTAAAVAEDFEGLRATVRKLEVNALLDKRPELAASTRAWLETQSVETVKGFIANTAKPSAPRNAKTAQGRSGPEQLVGEELDKMNAAMGLAPVSAKGPERREDTGEFVMHVETPTQLRARLAKKGA